MSEPILIAQRLGYIQETQAASLALRLGELDRILNGLISSLRRRTAGALAGLAVGLFLMLGTAFVL